MTRVFEFYSAFEFFQNGLFSIVKSITLVLDAFMNLRKKPLQNRSQVLYDSVLEAATDCFDKLGLKSTTTNKIAERAGVGIGSLYRYFPDKNSLLQATLAKYTEQNRIYFVQSLENLKGRPLDQAIDQMISLSIHHFVSKKKFFSILMSCVAETSSQNLIFQARQKLAQAFSESLIANFPEVRNNFENRPFLVEDLNQGFHAYMSALLAVIVAGASEPALQRLQQNMSNLFKSILLNSK